MQSALNWKEVTDLELLNLDSTRKRTDVRFMWHTSLARVRAHALSPAYRHVLGGLCPPFKSFSSASSSVTS